MEDLDNDPGGQIEDNEEKIAHMFENINERISEIIKKELFEVTSGKKFNSRIMKNHHFLSIKMISNLL